MAHGGHRPHSGQGRALPAVQGMLDARPGRCTRCGACACSCIVQSRVRRPGRRGSTTHQPLRRPPRRAIPAHVRTSPRGTQSSLMSCSSGPHRTRDGGCPEAAGSPAVRTATWSGAASAGGIGRRHGRRPVAAGAAAPAAAATAAAAAAAHDSSRRRVTRPRTSPPPPPQHSHAHQRATAGPPALDARVSISTPPLCCCRERLLSSVSLYEIAKHAYAVRDYDEAIIALEEALALRLFAYRCGRQGAPRPPTKSAAAALPSQ
jgi:hypothetical protein